MSLKNWIALAIVLAVFCPPVLAQTPPIPTPTTHCETSTLIPRPAHWAQPLERKELPNFFKVTDDLYRGGQPTAEGMRELKKMGIKTVINLRSYHSDRDKIGETGLAYEHIYMKTWHPEDEEVVRFLQIVTDSDRRPAFVHCQHGADRTGTMCAIYRVVIEGWSKAEAIREMVEGDFGFHKIWQNLLKFIRKLDIEDIKKRAGLAKPDAG